MSIIFVRPNEVIKDNKMKNLNTNELRGKRLLVDCVVVEYVGRQKLLKEKNGGLKSKLINEELILWETNGTVE